MLIDDALEADIASEEKFIHVPDDSSEDLVVEQRIVRAESKRFFKFNPRVDTLKPAFHPRSLVTRVSANSTLKPVSRN